MRRRYAWWVGPAAALGAAALWALGKSWRLDARRLAAVDAEIAAGKRVVFALWHSRLLPLVFTHRGRGVAVLVSRHQDGELITRLIRWLGYVTARGSSTRGGEEGLREMLDWAGSGRLLSITPDGPRGPAEEAKAGLVYLASRTGYTVLPVAAAARSCWRLRSWDGFRIPKPFARVVVGYGEPIRVPADLDREATEQWRLQIERELVRVTREMDACVGTAT